MNELLKLALQMLERRKVRSLLTMLGIFIGIAAIVSLVSLGNGLESAVQEQFASLGTDKIFVEPRGNLGAPGTSTTTAKLTDKDLETVRRVQGVEEAAGMLFRSAKIEVDEQVRFTTIFGMPTGEGRKLAESAFNFEAQQGRLLRNGDGKKVLGGSLYIDGDVFENNLKLRDKILINDEQFRIVGFLESFGNSGDDQTFTMPADVLQDLYELDDEWDMLIAKIPENIEASVIAEKMEKDLRNSRDVEEGKEDFTVRTAEEFMETFQGILNIIRVFLVGIASISLIVGGVGIANTMFTAVIERTQEIGVMKAIGAQKKDIVLLFLFESGILGLVGGCIGILLGYGVAKLVEIIIATTGNTFVQADISFLLTFSMLAFSFVFGAVAGVLPALQASKLKPTEALRYE